MADNLTTQSGTLATVPSGSVIAADDVSGVHFQQVKLDVGGDGVSSPVTAANPVPVLPGSESATTGNITASGQSVSLDVSRRSSVIVTVTGTFASFNGTFEASIDGGTTYFTIQAVRSSTNVIETTTGSISAAPTYAWEISVNGYTHFRLRATALTSGTVNVRILPAAFASENAPAVSLQTGTNSIGNIATVTTVSTVTNITNQGQGADDAAFTPGTTRVHMAGFFADEAATDSVNEGDMGAARMTLDRKQIVTPYAHADLGGHTPYKNLDVDETEDEIKATAGKLFWIHAINLAASVRYLKFYNATATTVVVGTTTPVLTFPIPTLGDTNGAGFTIHFGDAGVQFSTAITVAATTGLGDGDVGAPGTNEVVLNVGYL